MMAGGSLKKVQRMILNILSDKLSNIGDQIFSFIKISFEHLIVHPS